MIQTVGAAITPAAEWLIDSFHQVERQVREIRTDLPAGYYRQLPKLAEGPFARYPRVFEIAWAFVAHTDSRFDVDSWCGFLRAYQEVQYLTIGELWASAITLRKPPHASLLCFDCVEKLRLVRLEALISCVGRTRSDQRTKIDAPTMQPGFLRDATAKICALEQSAMMDKGLPVPNANDRDSDDEKPSGPLACRKAACCQ